MRCLSMSLLALLAASVSGVVAVVDFSFYPLAAQDCMYKASNSSNCPDTSVAETNKCLCGNGGSFVTNTAKCLGTSAPGEVSSVYKTMKQACSDSKTPLAVTEQQFLSAASTKTSTSSSKTKTSTKASSSSTTTTTTTATSTASTTEATPKPTGSQDPQKSDLAQENKGLSSGAKIGIITGGAVAGVVVLAAVAILLLRRRRRKGGEESHPMLAQSHNPSGHNFYPTPGETVVVGHDMGRNSGAGGWSEDAKWRPAGSPDPRNSTFNWETPYDPAASPPMKQGFPTPPPPFQQGFPAQQFKAYQPPSPQPVVPQPQVFELGGSTQLPAEAPPGPMTPVVEMEGTPIPQHGFNPRPEQGYPSQFGRGDYR